VSAAEPIPIKSGRRQFAVSPEAYIMRLYGQMKSDRSTYEGSAQQVCDHVIGAGDFFGERTQGQIRNQTIYDNTAHNSGVMLKSMLETLLTPMSSQFFIYRARNRMLGKRERVKRWLEENEDVMFDLVTRPKARFSPNASRYYHDLVFFGMGCMYVEDAPGRGVRFASRPLQEMYIAEDAAGEINVVMRHFRLTAMQAYGLWGENVGEKVKERLGKGELTSKMEFLHFVRITGSPEDNESSNTRLPWASTYYSIDDQAIISQGGFKLNPYVIARWETRAGETYGIGPGFRQLPLAKAANEVKRLMLEQGQMSLHPPRMIFQGAIDGRTHFNPGGKIYMRAIGLNQSPIRNIDPGGDPAFGIDLLVRIQDAIRQGFLAELIELNNNQNATAFQSAQQAQVTQRLLSPFLSGQSVEFLAPLMDNVYSIASEQDLIPAPPEEFIDQPFDIEYRNPVTLAQSRVESQALINSLTVNANLSQIDPTVTDNIDLDAAYRFIHEAEGAPLSTLVPEELMEDLREARAQAQARQAQIEEARESLQVAADAAPLLQAQGA
jgi:hypothetical protein